MSILGAGGSHNRKGESAMEGTKVSFGTREGIAVLRDTIGTLEIGSVLDAGRLRVFPLRQRNGGEKAEPTALPVLLCDALATGTAEVTEIDQHGSVPQLAVRNRGEV